MLAAFLVWGSAVFTDAQGAESVWGCLIYATNQEGQGEFPSRLSTYDQRLRTAVGYTHLRILGQGQTVVATGQENWLLFAGDLKFNASVAQAQRGMFLLGLKLFQNDREILETQARVSRGSPLFIRGPQWRDGQLILVVMIIG
jgi:hypothetical protein